MIDDLLDMVGTENRIGKTLHTDLGNGKMTLPLILLMDCLRGAEKEGLAEKLSSPSPNRKEIQDLIQRHKIAEKTERFTNEYFSRATDAIKDFNPGIRIHLENLSRFILSRDY